MVVDVCLGMDVGWMVLGFLDVDLGWVWFFRFGYNEVIYNDEICGIIVSISIGFVIVLFVNICV